MRVGFAGYSDGAPVAVSIKQGSTSVSASVGRWNKLGGSTGELEPDPPTTTPEGKITVAIRRSNLGVAPEGFQFEVTGYSGFDTPAPDGVFDGRYHDFHFLWDFGDEEATYEVPTRLPNQHRNANVGYGPAAGHVYKKHGTYKVSCRVIEPSSGKTALWTQNVTVGDREKLFADRATIYVDDEGKYVGAPDGAQTVTTLKAALDLCKTQRVLRRIMLRRGRKHHDGQYDFRTENDAKADWWNIWVESEPGAGAKPIIDCTAASGNAFWTRLMSRAAGPGTLDMVWFDVHFQGAWDSTTESGAAKRCFWMFDHADSPPEHRPPDYLMFQGCIFDGFSQSIYGDKRGVQFLSDSHITNWQDYGWFGYSGHLSILGTKIEQHVEALSGGEKNGQHNNHGPLRLHHAEQLVIDGSEFFSRNGWFPNIAGHTTEQPCIRFGMSSRPNDRMNLQRSILEGGRPPVAVTNQSGNTEVIDVNVRIESCLMIGTHMTGAFVNSQFGGITIRNNVMVNPNVPRINGIYAPYCLLDYNCSGIRTGDEIARTLVEFNTLVNLCSTANSAGQGGIDSLIRNNASGVAVNSIIEQHNLLHQPNLEKPDIPFKLDATVIAKPLCKGYRYKWERFTGSLSTSVANGASFTVSYSEGDASYFATTTGAHAINLGEATFEFGASSVRVTNASRSTWAEGKSWVMTLERDKAHLVPFDAATATPEDTVALYAPSAEDQSLLGTLEKVDVTIQDDYLNRERPPYLTIGALEPLF